MSLPRFPLSFFLSELFGASGRLARRLARLSLCWQLVYLCSDLKKSSVMPPRFGMLK